MSRMFDDRLGYRAGESVGWTPACDIFEDEDGVTLRFELAGVEPKDVDIRFENGVLTLKGERKLEKEEKRENYHRVELAYGTFTRSFSLPGTVDAEKIRAEAKNGVLTVYLPKQAEAKPPRHPGEGRRREPPAARSRAAGRRESGPGRPEPALSVSYRSTRARYGFTAATGWPAGRRASAPPFSTPSILH